MESEAQILYNIHRELHYYYLIAAAIATTTTTTTTTTITTTTIVDSFENFYFSVKLSDSNFLMTNNFMIHYIMHLHQYLNNDDLNHMEVAAVDEVVTGSD